MACGGCARRREIIVDAIRSGDRSAILPAAAQVVQSLADDAKAVAARRVVEARARLARGRR